MSIDFRKTAKIITLLLSSLLIAMASAQVYKYMYIDGSITIGSPKMVWLAGADTPGDATISESTATLDLDVEQGIPATFTEALFLKNVNTSGSFSILISIPTVVSSIDFTECLMHIYENASASPSWTYVDTLDLTNTADTYSGTLAAGNYLRMTFEVEADASASGTKPFDVEVRYE